VTIREAKRLQFFFESAYEYELGWAQKVAEKEVADFNHPA
jgi:hypothetical protein